MSYKRGEDYIAKKIFYNDEVGILTEQFFEMKKKIEDDYDALEKLALHDYLTGIQNRRYFMEFGERLFNLQKRTGGVSSVIMIDLDFFKRINDTHGHLTGDEILKQFVRTSQELMRKSDIFARYGGEEFVVLLPDTKIEDAHLAAEKIRALIEVSAYRNKDISISYTVSMGIAQSNEGDTLKGVIYRADAALYTAKETGRNRVCMENKEQNH